MRVLLLLTLAILSAGVHGGAAAAPSSPAPASAPGRVTAQFSNEPLRKVLATLFQQAPSRYVLAADVRDVAITARLRDLDLEAALRLVTQLAGATYTREGDRYLITALHAAPAPAADHPATPAARAPALPEATFDLQLREVPLRVALEQLFRGTGRQFAIETQVPDVPITINVRAVDLPTALRTITGLAGATFRQEGDGAGIYVIGMSPTAARRTALVAAPPPGEPPLSLDLQRVPFRKAVEQLFQLSGREYALSPDAPDGTITLHLNDVNFIAALDTLVRLVGASYRQEGKLFVIGPGRPDAAPAPGGEPAAAGADAADLDALRVDLSLDRVPFRLALETLCTQAKVKYTLAKNVENVPVTINLRDTDFAGALRVLTQIGNATYAKVGDTFTIRGRDR